MTGYGRCSETNENMEITAEIKAVNHRYFDFSSRVPRQFGFLDEKIKQYVHSRVNRGKVEVYITVRLLESEAIAVEVNQPLAKAYVDALNQLSQEYNLENKTQPIDVARFPDVLSVKKEEQDEDEIFEQVKVVLEKAVDAFIEFTLKTKPRTGPLQGDDHIVRRLARRKRARPEDLFDVNPFRVDHVVATPPRSNRFSWPVSCEGCSCHCPTICTHSRT